MLNNRSIDLSTVLLMYSV